MDSSALHLAILALLTSTTSALAVCAVALAYLRRVRLDRPPIGTFNRRDMIVLLGLLSTIPLLYLTASRWLVSCFLIVTFSAALSIGLRPLLTSRRVWGLIGLLLGLNLWLGRNALGTVWGWQLFWGENDLIVVMAAAVVANLYVQGGMRMRQVAWFALALAGYDVTFTAVYPVTNALVEDFLGFPLDPSVGMRWGFDNAAVGLGDLLVYAAFVLAARKGYGQRAAHLALGVVVVFGAIVPAVVPLVIDYVDARTDTLVPAQFWFGPAAFLTYLWLRQRHGNERTIGRFLTTLDSGANPAPVTDWELKLQPLVNLDAPRSP